MIGFDAFLAVFLATVVLVLKPGPYVITISSLIASGDWRKVASFWFGSITGGTVLYLSLLTGLSIISEFNLGFLFFLLKTIAATWFIWFGIRGLMAYQIDEAEIEEQKDKFNGRTFFQNFGGGFILTMSNPYDIVYVTTVIPALVNQTVFSLFDIFAIRVAVISADFLTLMVYILPVLYFKTKIKGDGLKYLNYATSIIMILIGLYVGYTAIMADDLISSGILN